MLKGVLDHWFLHLQNGMGIIVTVMSASTPSRGSGQTENIQELCKIQSTIGMRNTISKPATSSSTSAYDSSTHSFCVHFFLSFFFFFYNILVVFVIHHSVYIYRVPIIEPESPGTGEAELDSPCPQAFAQWNLLREVFFDYPSSDSTSSAPFCFHCSTFHHLMFYIFIMSLPHSPLPTSPLEVRSLRAGLR